MCLWLAAARKYVLISDYWYVLINGIVIRTHAMASLSDEDAVYLIKSVVGGLHICKRVRSPTVCEGLQRMYTQRQKR